VQYSELAQLNTFMNEVYIQLNVLRPLVMDRIRRHVHGGDIVAEHHRGLLDVASEFAKQLSQLDAFGRCIRHRTVFDDHEMRESPR
jgi:hypothetical protein